MSRLLHSTSALLFALLFLSSVPVLAQTDSLATPQKMMNRAAITYPSASLMTVHETLVSKHHASQFMTDADALQFSQELAVTMQVASEPQTVQTYPQQAMHRTQHDHRLAVARHQPADSDKSRFYQVLAVTMQVTPILQNTQTVDEVAAHHDVMPAPVRVAERHTHDHDTLQFHETLATTIQL